ncbi:PAS domain S-box protein [Halomicrococcus sp. NG-SE-24]|uniref:PAS domain-containing sensor histidine kinase n=1 Tax=Halomicrococcus sp. NG-SE-24 TaxID=3436928 RepID=UPI003D96DCFD
MSFEPGPLTEVLAVVEETGATGEPVTAGELAAELGCSRAAAADALDELAARGDVGSKRVDGTRVWWRQTGPKTSGETQFKSLVEAVEEYAIYLLDPDGRVATWNEGAKRIEGYDAAEIVGEHFSTFYTDEDVEAGVPERTLAAATEGNVVEEKGWQVRSDGSRFWASVTITALYDDDEGSLYGYAKVTQDLTDRREQERELHRERDLLQQVLDTSPVGIAVLAPDGTIERANPRAETILDITGGGDGSQSAEWSVYDADGEPLPPDERPFARAVESSTAIYNEEVQIEFSDGDRRWLSVSVAPIVDDDGTVERMVAAGEDITALKTQARRLERQRDELRAELGDVFERIDDAFFALDERWRFTYANEQAAAVFDGTPETLVGELVWERHPDVVSTEFREQFERAMDTQEPLEFEAYYPPVGSWLEVNVYPSASGLSVYFDDISKRKRREFELERYELLFETIEDGVYTVDEEGRFTLVNRAYAEMTGYDREELIGAHVSLVVDDEAAERGLAIYDELLSGDSDTVTDEAELRTKSGDSVPTEATFALLPTESGHERIGVVRDVTERKERERALEESERRYRTLAEHFPNGTVVLYDHDLRYTLVEGTLPDELDVDPDELVGSHVRDVHPPEVRDAFERHYRTAIEGEQSRFEVDYGDHVLRIRAIPVRDDDGQVFAGMGMSQDVTEQVEQRRALEKSEQRYRTLAEHFPDGAVGLYDHDLRYTLVEGAIWDELDVSADDLEGETVQDIFSGETADHLEALFRTALDGETDFAEVEFAGRIFETWATPVRDADGEILAGLSFSQDVTDRKQRERKLEQFASVVSHDLRNPLSIAQMYLTMAREEGDPDDFDEVERAHDRMETIIQTLLAMARDGQTIGEPAPVALSSVVESAWGNVETSDVTLVLDVADRTLSADGNRLQTVFENLFRNAVEHGDEDVEIRVGVVDDGFYVEDDGPGIPPNERREVFEYGNSSSGGTGFGLAIVREVVEAHGWDVTVTDATGGGARFEVRGVEIATGGE